MNQLFKAYVESTIYKRNVNSSYMKVLAEKDIDEVKQLLDYHRIAGLFAYHYKEQNINNPLYESYLKTVSDEYKIKNSANEKEIQRIVNYYGNKAKYLLFIKGDAVRNIVFKEIPWIRKSNDIDILVPEDKVAYFYNSLQTDLGYTINASASEEIAYRKMFQHCAPLVSENAKIDLHFRITQEGDGYKFDYEDFFKDAEIAESNGIKYQITSKEYTLFCLCYHQFMHEYREGKYMLKMNGDVYNLLDNVAINWNRFIDIVKKQNANFPIYYSLYACNKLYGYYLNSELVPQWVLQELEKEDYVKKFDGIVSRHLFDEEPFGYWKIPYEERIFWDRWDVRKEQVKYFFINEAQKRWKIKAEEMQVPLEDLVALTTQMWINDGNFFKENID